jgi:hypothetical protein
MSYSENELRAVMLAVNIFDRTFGASNCTYELFDAGHQVGVAVRFPDLCMRGGSWRHAERFAVGDEKGPGGAMSRMLGWQKATIDALDAAEAQEDAEMMAQIERENP